MKFIDHLEKRLGFLAIPHLALYLVALNCITYVTGLTNPQLGGKLLLLPDKVMAGEIWRLFTFPFMTGEPGSWGVIFFIFWIILLHLYASALEEEWGNFRLNLFCFTGWLGSVLAAMVPYLVLQALGDRAGPVVVQPMTGFYLYTSIFFAFATLNPNYQIYIFFILPVKVKYLAWIAAFFLGLNFLAVPPLNKLMLAVAMGNYIAWFWVPFVKALQRDRRRLKFEQKAKRSAAEALHRCQVCGRTERDDPQLEFRVNAQTGEEFCREHLPPRE